MTQTVQLAGNILQSLNQFISRLIHNLWSGRPAIFNSVPLGSLLLAILAICVCAALLVAVFQYRGKTDYRERLIFARRLSDTLSASGATEENLNRVLRLVSEIVEAPYYAFYLWDERSSRFMLRAASHPFDSFEGVAPAYSGLALPKREAYLPPTTLDVSAAPKELMVVNEGDIPLLVLPIGERTGLIRVGPIRPVNRYQRQLLREFCDMLRFPLEDFMRLDKNRMELQLRSLSDSAIIKIAGIASNTIGSIDILLKAFTGIVGGVGAIFFESRTNGSVRVHCTEQLEGMCKALEESQPSLHEVMSRFNGTEERIIHRADPTFYDFPVEMIARDDIGAIIVVPFDGTGALLILQGEEFNPSTWHNAGRLQLQFLTKQVSQMMRQVPTQRSFTKGYTRLLCQIADFVDNLNPFTVGYSDMMTHYSLAIGYQMGLSDEEMQDLALAARLSNIGVLAMDTGVLVKEGRYTDFEYSLMKRHSEISASMIELVTGNRRAAEYVLYHHERVDGNGYPVGLAGPDIPLPSKIIHVVQFFLAKVNGRTWRTPLSFETALEEIRNSAGTALDSSVVQAFEGWWEAQSAKSARGTGSLGYCYEMCCVPKAICETCPAYKNPTRCWEMPNNQCRLHGRDCNTCFVKTEYEYRMRRTSIV